MRVRLSLLTVLFAAGCAALAASARAQGEPVPPPPAPPPALAWVAPSPADGTAVSVAATTKLTLSVAAASPTPGAVVELNATGLPDGSVFRIADGNPATGTLTWTPVAGQAGDYTIIFGATDNGTPALTAPPLTVLVHVGPPPPPTVVRLTEGNVSRWAFVLRPTVARAAPNARARVVDRLSTRTGDRTQNLLSLLEERTTPSGKWVRARLAILPNNSTGWVPRSALGAYRKLNTHLYIDRSLMLAVLKVDGRIVWRTQVGIGKSFWPTPRGEFYIRDRLIGFSDTFYGPVAFGTSARSPVLTDWPGGGFVGVHGTSLPQLIPGQISHGCVRMRNAAILRLDRLMPVGTPLTIT